MSFGVGKDELNAINKDKDAKALQRLGGVRSLATVSASHSETGIVGTDEQALQARREKYGSNKLAKVEAPAFLDTWFKGFKDPLIILLSAAAVLSTVLGSAIPKEREKAAWVEGIAIWVAVFVVTGLGAFNEWRKNKQFQELNRQKNIIMVKAIRNGHETVISSHDVVVGDVLMLDTGDKIVADTVVIDSFELTVDEAALTGESEPVKKDTKLDPWCRSGTQVSEGSGTVLVIAVGESSEWGRTMELVGSAGDEMTPLQEKLGRLGRLIGKVGTSVAIVCFVALLVKWVIVNRGFPLDKVNHNGPVTFLMYSVTLIVVTIPEGLPLAVTLTLAYSMKKMMNDNNFVRVLAATETMGGATAICSDKTGTLTENKMSVTEGWFAGVKFDHKPALEDIKQDIRDDLALGVALNSKAFLHEESGEVEYIGNTTDCALLVMIKEWGYDYKTIRASNKDKIVKMFAFSSEKKMASVLIENNGKFRLHNKGAAEWVLQRCVQQIASDGSVQPMVEDDRKALLKVINSMAARGLRCICITYTEFLVDDPKRPSDFFQSAANVDRNLTAVAIVGIKDPVRQNVPEAVKSCQKAGIKVRMVTGDNAQTAQTIARECGILDDSGIVMEGPVFRRHTEEQLREFVPKLQVLARSSPEDKLILVKTLKNQGEVVAVTGDGTNDAAALKESDVGLAMGITGTEVAKEAADIIILDDNFNSIVKTVLWGRAVLSNIRKFLQFQLTVNLAALVVVFFGAIAGDFLPLSVLQLLWINLVMNSFAAMALSTEGPIDSLLEDAPSGRQDRLVTRGMIKHILWQASYQVFWLFMIIFWLPRDVSRYHVESHCEYYSTPVCVEEGINKFQFAPQDAQAYCSYLTDCGLPCKASANEIDACPLNVTQPISPEQAICGLDSDGDCVDYQNYRGLKKQLDKDFEDYEEKEFDRTRAVLFNTFLFCQVFNLINSRRIRDEYNIFSGLVKDKLFVGVLIFIVVFQALIMNFMGSIFNVTVLNWQEWLVTVAIGIGCIPFSTILRLIIRKLKASSQPRSADTKQANLLPESKEEMTSQTEITTRSQEIA